MPTNSQTYFPWKLDLNSVGITKVRLNRTFVTITQRSVPGAHYIMYEITGKARYKKLLDNWRQGIKDAPYTPNGMIHIAQWGSARHATNVAFLFALLGRFDNQDCFQPRFKCVENSRVYVLVCRQGRVG